MSKKFTISLKSFFLQMLFVLAVIPATAQVRQVNKTKLLQPVFASQREQGKVPVNKLGAYHPKRTSKSLSMMAVPAAVSTGKASQRKTSLPMLKVKGGPLLWGAVEYSSAWESLPEEDRPYGIYSFTASNPEQMKLLLKTGTNGPNAGGVFINDDFYYLNYYLMYDAYPCTYYYHYNTTTWEQIGYPQYGSDATVIGTDLAYDATTGNVYGYFYNPLDFSEPSRFGIITYSDYGASVTPIATEDTLFLCLTADETGQLYGISWAGGLWKIDKATGTKTLIDYMGVVPSTFRQSATYDPKNKKIYWAAFRNDYTSGIYEIDPTDARARLIAELPDSMEISCLYIPKEEAADDAPAAVSDLAAQFDGGNLTGHVTFTMPENTYAGDALTGNLTYLVVANGDTIATGTAQAGEKMTVPVTVTNGINELSVFTKNDAGRSPQSNKYSHWIGYDVPAAVTDVKFDFDATTYKATLTWTAPTTTLNGGYMDTQALTYDVVRYPEQDTVAHETTDTTFSETLPKGALKAYYYTVTPHNGNQTGEATMSNKQKVGDALDLPFVDDFTSDDKYALYTIIDANGDGKTWVDSYQAFAYFASWTNAADDWLLTPPLNLKKGEVYKLSFKIRAASSWDKERYAVAAGTGSDPTSYQAVIEPVVLNLSDYSTVETTFTVASDGVGHVGFHALSDKYTSGIYVRDIRIEKETTLTAPDSVTNLKVTPGEKGELNATLSFTTPTTDLNGNAIKSLQRIDIFRNDSVKVTTIGHPAVGTALSYTDTHPQNGMNYYKVVAVNEGGEGTAATDSVYVGLDEPLAPQHVTLHGADDLLTLTWDAPAATGIHGGYVDPDQLTYTVYTSTGEAVDSGLTERKWTYDMDLDLRSNVVYYFVQAQSAYGKSEQASSNYFVIGRAAILPYAESFANGGTTKTLWWTYGNISNNAFSFCNDASDEDDGAAYWFSVADNASAYLNSGKITAKGALRPVLTFDYYATPGAKMVLKAIADCNQNDADTLVTYDFASLQGQKGWRKAVIFLGDKEKNADYFVLKFLAQADNDGTYLYLDNIALRDMPTCDLAATLVAPMTAVAGDSIKANVTVSNLGFEEVGDATVSLYADQNLVDSKQLPSLASSGKTDVSLTFAPSMALSGEVKLYAVVNCEGDDVPSNNTTDKVNVTIQRPDYPAVNDLSAREDEQGTTLSWTAPATRQHVVTDHFDTYSPWSIDNIGPWTVVDGDTMQTNAYTCMHYPHIGEKMAYIVFNNQYGTMLDDQRDIFAARSGHQALAAFATVHDYTKTIPTADWLITPELSGEAQTVSFWAKSFTEYKEDLMIYASTESGDTASLKKNRIAYEKFEVGPDWKEFKYELPFGTKYFAVCYTSNLSGILIDDFTYETLPLTVVGYRLYRDGQAIADVPAKSTTYTDTRLDGADHTYTVTVVYKEGESDFSNIAQSITTGIHTTDIDAPQGKAFTTGGIKVADDAHNMKTGKGLYIINGKKVIRK